MFCNLILVDLSKKALYALESNGKGSNTILMFLNFRQGLKFQKYQKNDLYLVSFHKKSSMMRSAHKVLVMAPLEGGIVIVLETLKLLVPAVLSQ